MRRLIIATLVTAGVGLAAQTAPPPKTPAQPSATAPTGNAETGKRVFTTYYCYSCHGTVGQGGAGPRIIVGASAAALVKFVRKPTGTMPPYTSKSISEQEIIDIYAYLKSIPPSPPAKSIALLNQ